MKTLGRFTLSLAASAAVVLGLATTPGSAREQQPGTYPTSNGYRVPVYGMQVAEGADGLLRATCGFLTQDQIESQRVGVSISRAMALRSPRSTVQADDPVTAATFQVLYTDPEGQGFNDPQLGPQRKRAFEAALVAWSKVMQGTIPIVVDAKMPRPTTVGGPLAVAGPTGMVSLNGLALPTSLASQIVNVVAREVINEPSDLHITFNADGNWDYAVDGTPTAADRFSFVRFAIHELAHGMGFIHSYVAATGELTNPGIPFIFDSFLNRGAGGPNLITGHTADQIKGDLVSQDVFFGGPKGAVAALTVVAPLPMPKLHAPDPFLTGSSIAHFDETTYADPSVDLMTPVSVSGTGTDKIDALTLAVMEDMGYKLVPPPPPPPTPTRRR